MTREQEVDAIMWDLYQSRRILPNPPPKRPVDKDNAVEDDPDEKDDDDQNS